MTRLRIELLAALFVMGCGQAGPPPPAIETSTVATLAPSPSIAVQASDPLPTLTPETVLNRVPTRVQVPALEIDLPVVVPPTNPDHFPFCNVAEFLPSMSRPGRAGTTYLYAHARPGMFLPILERAERSDGRSMLGMVVIVYTSDDRQFTYEVASVHRHVVSLDSAFRATNEQLILQTSEGPRGTPGKTMLVALPRSESPASSTEAHPAAEPVRCG